MAGEHDEWLSFDEPAPGLLRQLRGHRPVGASLLVLALIALAVGVVALFRTSANQAAAPAILRSVAPFLGFDPYLAYDAKHRQVVLVNNPGQIWLWANRTWSMAHPAAVSSPKGCCGAAAWDPELGRVLLFEAVPPGDAQPLTFTYAWDGASWTQLESVAEYQPPVGAYSMAYDAGRQQMVLLASVGTQSGALEIETWIYQGGRWRRRSNLDSAAFSVISAVGFDARAHTLLALSGDSTGTGTQTWRWDGSAWHRLTPSHIPPESAHMTLVNEPGSGRLLLLTQTYGFGKRTVTQTWSWTGSDWIERGPLAVNDLVPYAVTAGNDLWAFQEIPTDSHGVRSVGVFRWNGAGWDQVAVARVSPARSG
jgi:hypothetical protein